MHASNDFLVRCCRRCFILRSGGVGWPKGSALASSRKISKFRTPPFPSLLLRALLFFGAFFSLFRGSFSRSPGFFGAPRLCVCFLPALIRVLSFSTCSLLSGTGSFPRLMSDIAEVGWCHVGVSHLFGDRHLVCVLGRRFSVWVFPE